MSVTLLIPGADPRVEIPDEPLALARAVLGELNAGVHLPDHLGRETDSGFEYTAADAGRMVDALELALQALSERLDGEGQALTPEGVSGSELNYFNERQWLRSALVLFRAAASSDRGVRVSL